MGTFGIFLLIGVVSGLLWLLRESGSPKPRPAPPPGNSQKPSGASVIAPVRSAEFPLTAPPRVQLATPPGVCAICRSDRPLHFQTERIALCQWCITLICNATLIDVWALHKVVFGVVVDSGSTYSKAMLTQVLDSDLLHLTIRRRMGHIREEMRRPQHRDDWLKFMRAYHLGLISCVERVGRPVDDVWKPLAHAIRVEDRHCMACGTRSEKLDVHHIIPLQHGGSNEPANLVSLCRSCHREQHVKIDGKAYFSLPPPDETQDVDVT